ncbi:hypothetical protein K438DRAFT_1861521, partial [Mycena galopus ATCC 62051]
MNGRSSGVCLSLPFVLPLTWDVFFWVPSLRYTVARPLRNRMVCVVPESSTCSVLLRYPLFGNPWLALPCAPLSSVSFRQSSRAATLGSTERCDALLCI